jgi:hypothetical protein
MCFPSPKARGSHRHIRARIGQRPLWARGASVHGWTAEPSRASRWWQGGRVIPWHYQRILIPPFGGSIPPAPARQSRGGTCHPSKGRKARCWRAFAIRHRSLNSQIGELAGHRDCRPMVQSRHGSTVQPAIGLFVTSTANTLQARVLFCRFRGGPVVKRGEQMSVIDAWPTRKSLALVIGEV